MKEGKEPRDFGLSFGDIGIIAIAAVFGLCGIYLMVGPSPFGDYFSPKRQAERALQEQQEAKREQQEAKKAAQEPQEDGVVTVGIAPEGKPQRKS